MSINVFRRYEKKFLMDAAAVERLLPTLREHMEPDRFCVNGRTYHICNLYFDTERDDVIRESLQHPYYKEKLRLRSYGIPASEEAPVFLELKKKVNGIVTKRRVKLRYGDVLAFLRRRSVPEGADYLGRQVLREVDYYLSHKDVSPTTLIRYDRMAWFDRSDRSFRLTFDSNLRQQRGRLSFSDAKESLVGEALFPPDFRLMEVKVSNAYPLWFAQLLSREGIRQHSFSKYGVAWKTWLSRSAPEGSQYTILGHI